MQLDIELPEFAAGHRLIAGVDEAGRGPLAGPVVAAAVILDPARPVPGLNDSKKLSRSRREACCQAIVEQARAFAVGHASVAEIDRLNILQASLLAMQRAVDGLAAIPEFIYVDGNTCPRWRHASTAVIKGDSRLQCVAAASILAKVTRDGEMRDLERLYPGYGFARHKGYPTRAHLQALNRLGPTPVHRRSFRPVADLAQASAEQARQ